MAILGFLFFTSVLATAIWTIAITVSQRRDYIVALLSGSQAAAVLVPVAQRRRVRRISPLSYRAEVSLIRAAA